MLALNDYDYVLPSDLIAQEPAKPRDHARLLCLDSRSGALSHRRFDSLAELLKPGDLLVLNDSKVIPARLIGRKESGGEMEVFLHRPLDEGRWECLIRGRARKDLEIYFIPGFSAKLLEDNGDGTWQVSFNKEGERFYKALEKVGKIPLPPYIASSGRKLDQERYQTVYAEDAHSGSVAAPTAGLHFTKRLLSKLEKKGVQFAPVTLHVGLGTFAAVKTEDIRNHHMHAENYFLNSDSAKAIAKAKREGRRIIAVGTTSCRVLESYAQAIEKEQVKLGEAFAGSTEIFIYPGYKFHFLSGLITNFHLPKSTLIMLVSALAGREKVITAYKEAVKERYRFYSYGDAMFVF